MQEGRKEGEGESSHTPSQVSFKASSLACSSMLCRRASRAFSATSASAWLIRASWASTKRATCSCTHNGHDHTTGACSA